MTALAHRLHRGDSLKAAARQQLTERGEQWTAMRESVQLLRAAGAMPVAAVIALDRQEQGPNGASAVAEMEREQGLRMVSLVNVREMLEFLERERMPETTVAAIRKYQAQYGVPA